MASSRTCTGLCFFVALILGESTSEIVISQGKLRGRTLTSRNGRHFSAFLGIPYAQPPVDHLRFKNPLPAVSWEGTFMAHTDSHQCPQYDDYGKLVGDEDCLYLNVYAPQLNATSLYPTMVYIHGGAFVKGSGSRKDTAPTYIMDQDVVLVTMNYRLGVLGFLSTGDAEAPGNFGLKDQVLGLRWVQKNIKAFGGDPNRVTLFGQSAGSVSVNLHVLSDASDGLFNQYIAQSGSSLCLWAYRDISSYKEHAIKLGNYVNCPTTSSKVLLDCLREMDAYSLVNTNDIFDPMMRKIGTWSPTNEPILDGAFLTTSPIDRMLNHGMRDYPWITGAVADEGLIMSALLYTNETLYNNIAYNFEEFLETLIENFIGSVNPAVLASSTMNFYFKNVHPSNKKAFIKSTTNLLTDVAFTFPTIVQMQMALQRMREPFYFYSFDYRGTYSGSMKLIKSNENIGVTHNDDLIYLFPPTPEMSKYNRSSFDEFMIDVMTDFWTSFAANGVPTSKHIKDPHIWTPYTSKMNYLQIGNNRKITITQKKHFREKRLHFWIMQVLKAVLHIGV